MKMTRFGFSRPSLLGTIFGRRSGRRLRAMRQRAHGAGRMPERLEDRRLLAFDFVAAFTEPGTPFFVANVSPAEVGLTASPQQITLRFSPGTVIDQQSLASGISVVRTGRGGDAFDPGGAFADQPVTLGSLTVNDAPNQNEVIVRFAETLPDDTYRITIQGDTDTTDAIRDGLVTAPTPPLAIESFRDGGTFSFDIRLNLGAHVVSVVPQPVIRARTIDFKALPADADLLEVAIRGGRRTFEFDSGNGVQTGNTPISLTAATVNSLASAVATAINALSTAPGFTGELSGTSASAVGAVVTLTGTSFTPVISATRGGSALPAAVVTVGDGALTQLRDRVVVHFNANDPLNAASAQNAANYQLFHTDPATGAALGVVTPTGVSYDAVSGTAVLSFAPGAVADDRLYRLQVGSSADANNTLVTAVNVGTILARPGGVPAYTTTARLGDNPTVGANDVDLYRVRLTAGGAFSVTATPDAGLDVVLRLFAADGTAITSGNGFSVSPGGPGVATTLSYTPTAAGEFLIGVSSAGNAAYSAIDGLGATGGTTTGSYGLAVTSTVAVAGSDDNSSYATATPLGTIGLGGTLLAAAILNRPTVPTPAGDLPFPDPWGALDYVGQRDIPVDGGLEQHGMPGVGGAGPAGPIVTRSYNFASIYGSDPQGNTLYNAITETQKQRAREIFDLFSQYLGIRFVESAASGIQVVTGDMRALEPTIPTGPGGLAALGGNLAIMNSTIDWGDSEYGGAWFQVAMHEIGHNLGLLHSYDLPSIMGAGEAPNDGLLPTEPVFPGNYDIEHALQLLPRSGTDVDLYSFQLEVDGRVTAETIVARPGQPVTSYLDTVLTLYREVSVGGVTTRELVARNDDSFGRDSFIGLDLAAQDAFGNRFTYYVAVSSTGNTDFNPAVENSGAGGRSEGAYQLQLGFTPAAAATPSITDTSGTPLDGDRDGVAGGSLQFWFQTAAQSATVFVDKAAPSAGAAGTLANPFTTIAAAISAVNAANGDADPANDRRIIRIVGNEGNAATLADDRPYLIGRAQGQTGPVLADGATFNVPRGVTAIIDAGAVIKLRGAVIDVGSSSPSPLVARPGAALQVLGTPGRDVRFTSYHDDAWGGDSDGVGPAATGGQWGGIVLRQDSDIASKRSFVNSITNASFRFGGGQVVVDSQLKTFAPIQLESTRPTIAFNTITQSAGAAMSADPNSFEDSAGRVGPELRGNRLVDNTINGLFVRIETDAGSALTKLTVPARFKSADIVYVITENLVIDGGAGGYLNVGGVDTARPTGRLTIDPGVVVKLTGSRIELERGFARLYAEGLPGSRVIFTSLADGRYGAGGTFDTNGNQADTPAAGNWAGIIVNAGSSASIDQAYVGFGGGTAPIEGRIANFNVFEVHQGDLRLANSRVENNAGGFASADGTRTGRGTHAAATVFVRGAQPVIVGNDFRDNLGTLISVNANALDDRLRGDVGRGTGAIGRLAGFDDNFGPLVRNNRISYTINAAAGRPAGGATGGMEVRGEELTVEGVWDDTDIVHVLTSQIQVRNFHTATALRLLSQSNASLVVKALGASAGLVASGVPLDIDDRIGGTVQVIGQPGYPVILTSLRDDTVYASLDPLGRPNRDTNNDASASAPAAGNWRGLQFLELSNDRNVGIVREAELAYTSAIDRNAVVDDAQVLGTLAPNFAALNSLGVMNSWESAQEKSGDETRRLGFEVHGTIALDDPSDVDVYSLAGYAGSEVWIDVDKTSPALDAMIELIDADGNVLARSVDALNDVGVVTAAAPNVVAGTGTGTTRTYQLAPGSVPPGSLQGVLPGTLAGVLYRGNTGIQRFTVARDGTFTFTSVGSPAVRATAATLNRDTGLVTFTFNGDPGSVTRIEAAYEFSRLPLATLGFTATGTNGGYSLTKDAWRGNDHYSANPRDAGMRVILPGTVGTLTQYFIRVRSQPAAAATGPLGQYAADLEDPALVATGGATAGRYELRVRLRQQDEKPGSTVRYADIRYPVTGIEVIGLPRSSPLVSETGEHVTDSNGAFGSAQPLGNLLTTDRNTISVAGEMANAGDIDWYSFTLDYDLIQSIAGVSGGAKTWATMFDIDYADGFRGDLTLSVFDATGRLLYIGRDSDIADDQPGAGQGNDFDDLSRGSAGKLDPYIGTVQLPAGGPGSTTRYFLAVSSNERLPQALNAYLTASPLNPQIRLEPINSVRRVVQDRIGEASGYIAWDPQVVANEQLIPPDAGAIIDLSNHEALAAHIRPFTLADVTLFVSTNSNHIYTVDAYRGGSDGGNYWETRITGDTAYPSTEGQIADLDMRTDGSLMMYQRRTGDAANNGQVFFVNAADGVRTLFAGDGIADDATPATADNLWLVTGPSADAFAIRRSDVATYASTHPTNGSSTAIVYSIQDGGFSYIYAAQNTGSAAMSLATPPAHTFGRMGRIDNAGITGSTTGLQFRNETGDLYGVSSGGQFFRIQRRNATAAVADTPLAVDQIADFSAALGGESFQGLATGPVNLEGGRYQGTFFAITNRGRLVVINPDGAGPGQPALMANVFDTTGDGYANSHISNRTVSGGETGVTGLAFSPLDVNLWHPTIRRGDSPGGDSVPALDPGHGVNTTLDNTRASRPGVTSMYFGLEEWDGTNGYAQWRYGRPGQYGTTAFSPYDWQRELTASATIGNNYNLPGGAYGSLITNPFSLAGYASTDKPTLYFNYFLETQNASGRIDSNRSMRDSARAFISTDDGLTWTLLATNNQSRSDNDGDAPEAELPNTLSVSSAIGLAPNQHVQELFDTAEWRQARVDLGNWAGASSIRLRFDFSTAGMVDATDRSRITPDAIQTVAPAGATVGSAIVRLTSVEGLQVGMFVRSPLDVGAIGSGAPVLQRVPAGATITAIDPATNDITLSATVETTTGLVGSQLRFFRAMGDLLNDIDGAIPANNLGSFRGDSLLSRQRGANNAFEGFYIDDIIVGFAERGEMVTGAVADQTAFVSLNTPILNEYTAQVLQGPYQLQIRRGTEYAVQPSPLFAQTGITQLFDTNTRLVRSPADTVLTLEEHTLSATGGAVSTRGSGTISPDSGGLQMGGNGGTSTQHNAVFWSIDLDEQRDAFLEFEYRTGRNATTGVTEPLTPLPATFTLASLATGTAGNQLPAGDGVAISVNGGLTWTTIANFTATINEFRSTRLNLNRLRDPDLLSATTVIGFFQSGPLTAAAGGGITVRNALITTAPRVATTGLVGDQNLVREQGQFLIEGNIVSNASQYGIRVDAAGRDPATGAPRPGVAMNLPTLNNQQLVPGAVITNNIVSSAGTAGILFSGQTTSSGQPPAVVPFGRIVNNTFFGGGSGVGVQVTDNASPTLLNNLFANLTTGVSVDAGSAAAGTIVAYSAFWSTAAQVTGTSQSDQLVLAADPFVNAAGRNFYLAPGSAAIDSSLDVLQDRNQFVVLKNAVGIAQSPILAPGTDLYAQLRLDDPDVAGGSSGLGVNAFKDRGAVERADFVQPTAALVTPLDNSTSDVNGEANVVRLERSAARGLTDLVIQLADTGIGIDDATVTTGTFVVEFRPLAGTGTFAPLADGTDYVFQYLENTKTVVFQSPSVFPLGEYLITVDNSAATGVRDLAGNRLLNNDVDGAGTTAFTIALVDVPDAPTGLTGTVLDGAVELAWVPPAAATGASPTGFFVEHSTDGITWTRFPVTPGLISPDDTTVTIPGLLNGTAYQFRIAAVNDSGIVTTNGTGVGPFSTIITVTPLATPTLTLATDTGLVPTDAITQVGTVNVGGLQTSGTWEYSIDDGAIWTAGTNASFVLPEGVYPAGTVLVRQTFPVPSTNTSQIGFNADDFVVDQTPPAPATLALATGITDPVSRPEALRDGSVGGIATVTGEAEARIVVTFSDGTNQVTKTLTGTGSAQPVVLVAADLGGATGLADGTITVTASQTDLAGNAQAAPVASLQFVLDTIPPSGAATLALGPGITPPVSRTEALQTAGVVTVAGDPGNLVVVVFTRGTNTVSKTVTAAIAPEAVTLTAADLATLGNGLVTVTATQTDPAGNPQTQPVETLSFTLDAEAPLPVGLVLGSFTEPVSAAEATQTAGIVLVTGEPDATIAVVFTGPAGSVPKTLLGTGTAQAVTLSVADLALLGDGPVSVTATQTDLAGNPQAGTTPAVGFTLDATPPAAPALAAGTGVADGATLTEATQMGGIATVTGESGAAIVVTLTRGTTTITRTFTGTGGPQAVVLDAADVAALGEGVVTVTATQTDLAGNPQTVPAAALLVTIDVTLPTVTIVSASATLRAGQTTTITFTLSEPSTTFGVGDVAFTGGTLSGFDGAGTVYTATFTPLASSTAPGTVTVAAATFIDTAGNPNVAGALVPTIAIDTVFPTLTVTSSMPTLRIGQTALLTFVLSEPATDFTASSVTVGGGTLSGFTGSGTAYAATFTPTADSTAPGTVAVAAGTFTDAFGNPNLAGSLVTPIAIDTVPPRVTITSADPALRAGQSTTITFLLSEPATNFAGDDVVVTGGTLSALAGSGTLYTAVFTPFADSTAPGTVSVAAGRFTDAFGNGNLAGMLTIPIVIDTVPPTIGITAVPGAVAAGQIATITFTLSEPATDFGPDDVVVSGGRLDGFTGSGTTYTAVFTPDQGSTAPGTVTVAGGRFTDAAGNPNVGGSLAPTIAVDTVVPGVTITSSAAALIAGQTATITFTLSEPAVNFDLSDVTVTGGTLSSFTGSGAAYTALFTPTPDLEGTATVAVAAGRFTDAFGNPNISSAVRSLTIDTLLPIVTGLSSPAAGRTYTIGETISIVATLSEAVPAGGTLAVRLNTGSTIVLTAVAGTTALGSYVVQPGHVTSGLAVVAIIPNGSLRDVAGNPLTSTALPPGGGVLGPIRIGGAVTAVTAGSLSTDPALVPAIRTLVSQIPVTFSAPVTGVSLASFRLYLNGRSVSLRGARVTGSGSEYRLQLPTTRVRTRGIYTLEVVGDGKIRAAANNAAMTESRFFYWGRGTSIGASSSAKLKAFAIFR